MARAGGPAAPATTFSAQLNVTPPLSFLPIEQIKVITPGDPGPLWLIDPTEVVVFTPDRMRYPQNLLEVVGEGGARQAR